MRSVLLLTLLSLAVPGRGDRSSGCQEVAKPEEKNDLSSSIEVDGRQVLISYPPKYQSTKSSSLILVYHDKDMTPADMAKLTQFNRPALNRNAIVVYPSGRKGTWMTDPKSAFVPHEYSWDSSGDDDPENDLFFTTKLLDHLQSTFCINTRRIYATGLGMGGGMIHQLACHTHLSRRIGAFASVGAAYFRGEKDQRFWGQCPIGRRPIPILQIHGEKDRTYPLKKATKIKKINKKDLVPAEEWLEMWQDLNKCGAAVGEPKASTTTNATVMTELEGGQLSESITYGGTAVKTSYRCGLWPDLQNNNFQAEEKDLRKIFVLQYAIKDFGHGWPRVQGNPDREVEFRGNMVKPQGSPNFDASGVIINFFTHHRLPDSETVHAQAKILLYERGAKKYDERNIKWTHGEL